MAIETLWTISPAGWSQARGLVLVAYLDSKDWEPSGDFLDLAALCAKFGRSRKAWRRLQWRWRSLDSDRPRIPPSVALLDAVSGARVPLIEIERRGMGHPFVVPTPGATWVEASRVDPSAELVDYVEAARLMGVRPAALRQRLQWGQIPASVLKRTDRRVQFVRPKLLAWLRSGGSK